VWCGTVVMGGFVSIPKQAREYVDGLVFWHCWAVHGYLQFKFKRLTRYDDTIRTHLWGTWEWYIYV